MVAPQVATQNLTVCVWQGTEPTISSKSSANPLSSNSVLLSPGVTSGSRSLPALASSRATHPNTQMGVNALPVRTVIAAWSRSFRALGDVERGYRDRGQ
jgi:hypothetical protein